MERKMERADLTIGFMAPDVFTGTGYSVHADNVIYKLKGLGYNMIQLGNQHFSSVINLKGIYTTPRYKHPWGVDVIPYFAKRYGINLLINLWDPWAVTELPLVGIDYINWVPIDSIMRNKYAMPDNAMQMLESCRDIWALTRFGVEQFKNLGFDAKYVPLGVNHDTYRPAPRIDLFKRKFVFGWIGRNITSRKGQAELMEAFSLFYYGLGEGERKDVCLYLHTEPGSIGDGYDMMRFARYYGVENAVFIPGADLRIDAVSTEELVDLYHSIDCFVTLSRGEGFNIPLLEAMACGLPVIAHDVTANAELIKGTYALRVKSGDCHDVPTYTPVYCRMPIADVHAAADAMDRMFHMSPEERKKIGDSCLKKSMQYDWDKTVGIADGILQETMIKGKVITIPEVG